MEEKNSSSIKNIVFLLNTSSALTYGGHFVNIIKFEHKRLEYLCSNSVVIIDFLDLLNENDLNSKILRSIDEIKIWKKNISNKKPIFIINSINPIIDFELIKNLLIHFKTKNHNLIPLGAIPGTSPEIVVNADSLTSYFTNPQLVIQSATPIYWDTQRKYNNQFNLARPLRLKIFLKLLQTIDSLHRISIEHFIKKLESQEIFNFILDYGESNLHIKEIKKCPHCASRNLKPIFCGTSQPALGYLPSSQYFYIECMDCQLVLLRRQCHVNDIHRFYDIYERPPVDQEQVIEDLVSNKGGSHFDEKLKVLDIMEKLMDRDAKVVDIGGGFGEFSCLVKKRNPTWNVSCIDFDLEHVSTILKKHSVTPISTNFLQHQIGNNIDLITALHVVEHIPFDNLLIFFQNMRKALNPHGYLLLTTPNYLSPLAKFFDYHLVFPPVHQTILSVPWLENFLEKNNLFKKITEKSSSVILENYQKWFSYFRENSPNEDIRSSISIFDILYKNKSLFHNVFRHLNDVNAGSESIVLFQKT